MWINVLIVGAGSFVGGALRYLVSVAMRGVGGGFPWATLTVNIVGSLAIGVLYGLFARYSTVSHSACLLLTTGLCGGFTTFSTFSNEALTMLQSGNIGSFAGYVSLSLLGGLAAVMVGTWLARIA